MTTAMKEKAESGAAVSGPPGAAAGERPAAPPSEARPPRRLRRYTEAERADLRARAQDFLDHVTEQAMTGALAAFERMGNTDTSKDISAAVSSARTLVSLVRAYLAPPGAGDGADADPLEARAREFDYSFASREAPPVDTTGEAEGEG